MSARRQPLDSPCFGQAQPHIGVHVHTFIYIDTGKFQYNLHFLHGFNRFNMTRSSSLFCSKIQAFFAFVVWLVVKWRNWALVSLFTKSKWNILALSRSSKERQGRKLRWKYQRNIRMSSCRFWLSSNTIWRPGQEVSVLGTRKQLPSQVCDNMSRRASSRQRLLSNAIWFSFGPVSHPKVALPSHQCDICNASAANFVSSFNWKLQVARDLYACTLACFDDKASTVNCKRWQNRGWDFSGCFYFSVGLPTKMKFLSRAGICLSERCT